MPGDAVVSAETIPAAPAEGGPAPTVLTVTANGYGKRTELAEYRVQSRGGKGIITIKTTERNGPVVSATLVSDAEEVMLITNKGMLIRMPAKGISVIGRNTQGVRLITVESRRSRWWRWPGWRRPPPRPRRPASARSRRARRRSSPSRPTRKGTRARGDRRSEG